MLSFFTGLHQDNNWLAVVCSDIGRASSLLGRDVHPVFEVEQRQSAETRDAWNSPGQVFRQALKPKPHWVPAEGDAPTDDEEVRGLAVAATYFRLARCVQTAKEAKVELTEMIRAATLNTWSEIYYFCRRQGADEGLAWGTANDCLRGNILGERAAQPSRSDKLLAVALLQCLLDDPDHLDIDY